MFVIRKKLLSEKVWHSQEMNALVHNRCYSENTPQTHCSDR